MSFLFYFIFSGLPTWSTVTLSALALLQKPPATYSKLAPFNDSHDCFKVKLHPFKPVVHITRRDPEKSVYLQFIAEWKPQDKSGTCASYYGHALFSVMRAACTKPGKRRRGGIIFARHICMIPDFEMEKSKESFLEQYVNFLAVSSRPGMVQYSIIITLAVVLNHQRLCTPLLYHRWSQGSWETCSANKSSHGKSTLRAADRLQKRADCFGMLGRAHIDLNIGL